VDIYFYEHKLVGAIIIIIIIIIQFNSCLFTCKQNSTVANYKVSTVIWKYTKITKEQDTKHDSLYNGNKLIIVPRKILVLTGKKIK
jgi:hypothetical protein